MIVRKILLVFFCLIFLINYRLVSAADEQQVISPEIKIYHVAGGFEKIKEKIILFFKFNNNDKTDYYQYLAEKRLAEVYFVVNSNQINLLEPTASRYSTHIGNLTNFVTTKKISAKKDGLVGMFERHIKIVEEIQKKVPVDSGWWIALRHDINSAKDFKEKIEKI